VIQPHRALQNSALSCYNRGRSLIMPIYEYSCRACGHLFEHWHASMSEPAPACPECGGEVKRRISAPASRASGARTGPGGEAQESAPSKSSLSETGVFGRKELNASLAARGRN
jgi:putative FmdB family regulatory protein